MARQTLVTNAAFVLVASYLLLSPALAASPTRANAVGPSVFDDGICFDSTDCLPTAYCADAFPYSICRKRRPFGAACFSDEQCARGAVCRSSDGSGSQRRCRPRAALRERCDISSDCHPGLLCDTVCVRGRGPPGKAGAACYEASDCDHNSGFYCDVDDIGPPSYQSRCRAKKAAGALCGLGRSLNECLGSCAFWGNARNSNKCVPTRPLGATCGAQQDCLPDHLSLGDSDVVCNMLAARQGRCAKKAALLKKLGAPCTRANDLCDARRGLSCRWSRARRRTVCQTVETTQGAFCKRGSPFSRACARGLECRVARSVPSTRSSDGDVAVRATECQPRLRFAQAGATCDVENVRCAGNTSCRVVPGVALNVGTSRLGPNDVPLSLYCVRTLKRAGQCSPQEKFLAMCEAGLECNGGKCVNQAASRRVPTTHAGEGVSCDKLPCAPGFKCGRLSVCERV